MDNIAVLSNAPRADTEYEASVDALIAEMNRVRAQMATDQREIERLRAETDLILAQIAAGI